VIVFELDLPELLEQKQAILEQEHAESRCHRVVVAADLAEDDWPRALRAAEFDSSAPAMFIAEGLSWYLTEDEHAALLDTLAPSQRLEAVSGSTS
jgi:methyltransferase (TIGR00027 family)